MPADASFCPHCGVAVAGAAAIGRRVPPWWAALGAASAVVTALGLVIWRGRAVPRAAVRPASAAAQGAEAIPDISTMTPQERFDRLYDRLMRALRSGDTATVARFAPMALGAYQMLDAPDDATRRRAALLRLHLGDTTAARELGTSGPGAGRAGPLAPAP